MLGSYNSPMTSRPKTIKAWTSHVEDGFSYDQRGLNEALETNQEWMKNIAMIEWISEGM